MSEGEGGGGGGWKGEGRGERIERGFWALTGNPRPFSLHLFFVPFILLYRRMRRIGKEGYGCGCWEVGGGGGDVGPVGRGRGEGGGGGGGGTKRSAAVWINGACDEFSTYKGSAGVTRS